MVQQTRGKRRRVSRDTVETEAAKQRLSLPWMILKWAGRNWLPPSQAAFKSSHVEFGPFSVRLSYKETKAMYNCCFHISLSLFICLFVCLKYSSYSPLQQIVPDQGHYTYMLLTFTGHIFKVSPAASSLKVGKVCTAFCIYLISRLHKDYQIRPVSWRLCILPKQQHLSNCRWKGCNTVVWAVSYQLLFRAWLCFGPTQLMSIYYGFNSTQQLRILYKTCQVLFIFLPCLEVSGRLLSWIK